MMMGDRRKKCLWTFGNFHLPRVVLVSPRESLIHVIGAALGCNS
jgi:hypothetical protein